MSDYDRQCNLCRSYIALDEETYEHRNDYGYPVEVCEGCHSKNSDNLSGYNNYILNCS